MRRSPSLLIWALLSFASPAAAQSDFQQRPAPAEPPPPKAPTLTKAPKLKAPAAPVYPPDAFAAGIEGDVTLQIDIDAEGNVTAATVTKPAGHGFDEAATEAARAMTFEPAEIDGKPAAIRIEYVMRFRPVTVPAAAEAPPPPPPAVPPAALPPTKELMLRGMLRERGTRDPISGADVTFMPVPAPGAPPAPDAISEVVATTDDEGRFQVEAVPGRPVRVVVSSGEHEPCVRDVVLPGQGASPLEIACLVPRRAMTYETVVQAPPRGADVTRHTLGRAELTTVPGTFGDPLRVIQNLPGIARSPYGLGLLLIRGASPQDSGVYIDGHKVPLLYHFLGGPSVLTPDLIDRIDFFPGGFGVRYGRATAGVIDVGTRTEPLRRVHGSADVDFLDSGAYLEGPLGGGFSGSIAARRSYVDTLLPLVLPEDEATVAPVYWDYQARASRDFGGGERLTLFAFGSSDTLDVVATSPDQGDIDLGTSIGFHRVIGTWVKPLGAWVSRLSPAYGYDKVSFSAGRVGGGLGSHVLGLREDLTRSFGKRFSLAVGVDGELRFDGLDFDVPLPVERRVYGMTERTIQPLSRTLTNLGTAAYVEAQWDVTSRLRVTPGLRFDWFHYNETDRTSWDPRLVIRWARTDAQTFKAGAGIFHQPPQPQELDATFGNPSLPLIWSDQYHLGIEQKLTDAISLDGTVYYLRRHELPLASARQDASGRLERYASEGRGRSYGLELLLKHSVTANFFGWIAYTFARSEEIAEFRNDPNAPAPPYTPTQFDQTHNFIAVASRRLGNWELGLRFRLTTGVPDTPILGAIYDSDFNDWDPVRGTFGSTRRQTFHQLDLRAEHTWVFEAWRFSAYLDVQNVYNAENPEATIYDYRYRQSGPVRGLPILPVLGIRGRF